MAFIEWRSRIAVLLATLACAAVAPNLISRAQGKNDAPPPGEMRLLPGYRHVAHQGIDTIVGRISKEVGPTISYDIGFGASSAATRGPGDNTLWVKESTIGPQTKFVVNMQSDGVTLLVDVGSGSSFVAQNVRTKEDLAEVLLMLMSYRPFIP